jgi:MSHA biogenesis protein MshN
VSLINQMLTDLEARRGGNLRNVDHALDGLTSIPVSAGQTQRRSLLLVGVVLLMGIGVAATVWYLRFRPENPMPVLAQPTPPPATDTSATPPAPAQPVAQPVILADAPSPPSPPAPVSPSPAANALPSTPAMPAAPAAASERPHQAAAPRSARRGTSDGADNPAPAPAPVVEEPGSFHRAPAVNAPAADALAYERALRRLDAGASDELQSFVAGHPAHVAARERLALAWLAAGQTEAAETLLRAGLQANPGEIRFARLLGHSLLSRGLAQESLTLLRPLAPAMAKDPDYHALLAAAEQGTGAHALAATRYRGLLQLQPANGQWLVGLGISLAALGDSQAAAAAFNRSLDDRSLAEPLRAYAAGEHVRLEGLKP